LWLTVSIILCLLLHTERCVRFQRSFSSCLTLYLRTWQNILYRGARVRRDGRRETSGANSVTNHPYPIVSASHEHSNFIDEICNQSVYGFRERDDECSKVIQRRTYIDEKCGLDLAPLSAVKFSYAHVPTFSAMKHLSSSLCCNCS